MKLKIKITPEILKESMFCSAHPWNPKKLVGQNCAIGKAIFNLFGNYTLVEATHIHFFEEEIVPGPNKSLKSSSINIPVPLPNEAVQFIAKFDKSTPEERVKMEPFSFEIDVPMSVIEQIGIGQAYKVLSESKTLELIEI